MQLRNRADRRCQQLLYERDGRSGRLRKLREFICDSRRLGIKVTSLDLGSTGLQPGITGPGRYIYADAIMDAYAGAYTGEEWITITATSVNSKNKAGKWNWDSFLGFSGYEFLGNFGFLTDKLPNVSPEAAKAAGPTFKASAAALKKDKASRRTTLQ